MSLPDFSNTSSLAGLDQFLADKSYVDGYVHAPDLLLLS